MNAAPTIYGLYASWGLGTMLLESDGSVMANEDHLGHQASNLWFKLTPDNTGS